VNDAGEADDLKSVSLKHGLSVALHDYRLYLFIILQHLSLLSQTFQYFFPSIVKTLGYGHTETLLLTAPVWFGTFLVSLLVTFTAGKTGDRSIHIICLMLVSCIGNIIATSTHKTGPRFFAMFLMPMGAVSSYQIILTWIANSFPRPLVKRSASIAICNMIGNTASIYGSYMYPESAAPQYLPGGSANSAICATVALMALAIRFVLRQENRKLEKMQEEQVDVSMDVDKRATEFRYVL
jgi:MFS family permease